jgi:DNA-binding NtrC family response regulator
MTGARGLGWKDFSGLAPRSARVLVVDDDAGVRKSLERVLAIFGYETRSAPNAEQADHWLGAERFDAMLLDIELPGMKGVEFLPRAFARDPELAVLMLTGLDDPELAVRCLEKGARTYLVKPIETELLRLALRDALAVRRLLQERNAREL